MSDRTTDLLRSAADAFLDGRDPFGESWLAENKVTFNECMDMSDAIGVILKGFCSLPPGLKHLFLAGGAISGGTPAELVETATLSNHPQPDDTNIPTL